MSFLRKYSLVISKALLLVVAFMVISAYQARNLLASAGQPAPLLQAMTLDGELFDLADFESRPVLIYFFAPWCPYCSASADNIVRLRRLRSEEQLAIVVVALAWTEEEEVLDYASKHKLNVPVIMGNTGIAAAWKVYAFPTYYVLDSHHRVVRRDLGYSSQLGLLWRSWLVE